MTALRITDSDVKRQPELIRLALSLLDHYHGNWDALNAMVGVDFDDVKTARQVLNMFLSSTECQADHNRIRAALMRPFRDDDDEVKEERRTRLRIVKEPKEKPRKVQLTVPTKIKRRYGRSTVKTAVCHIIDHNRTTGRWNDEGYYGWRGDDYSRVAPRWKFSIFAKWQCGTTIHVQTSRTGKTNGVFMDEPDRKVCAKCLEMDALLS